MADFIISESVPYIVETPDGKEHALPRLNSLDSDQVVLLADMPREFDPKRTAEFSKDFCIAVCPELAEYNIGAMVYMKLFQELAKGSGIDVGESQASG